MHLETESSTIDAAVRESGDNLPTSLGLPSRARGSDVRGPAWLVGRVRGYGVLVVVVVYAAFLFAYVFPQDLRAASRAYLAAAWCVMLVRTFVFHIGLGLLLVAALAWWCRLRRLAITTVPALVVTLAPVAWQMVPRGGDAGAAPTLRVMSANLLWLNEQTDGIVSEVVRSDADVLLFQEFTPQWRDAIGRALEGDYPYRLLEDRLDAFGAAIYSRHPFVGPVAWSLPLAELGLPELRAVIDVKGTQIAVYNVHLMPPRSLNRLRMNRVMLADLLDLLAAEHLPVVIGGDFNFTPTSSQAAAFRGAGFAEAHAQAGWGRGSTWPVTSFYRYVPGVRLDQIYMRGTLACVGSRTGVGAGSDHRPVVVDIRY